jgi:hypothetical protein
MADPSRPQLDAIDAPDSHLGETVERMRAFLRIVWAERAAEYGREAPEDLTGACVFATAFARTALGAGEVRGNWHHTYLQMADGTIVDLTEGAGVAEQARERMALHERYPSMRSPHFVGPDVDIHMHDEKFMRSRDFQETWQSVQERAGQWAERFGALERERIDLTATNEAPEPRPAWLPDVLYHWTEGDPVNRVESHGNDQSIDDLLKEGFRRGVYLTVDGHHPIYNSNIFAMRRPVRIAIDTRQLDPSLFGPDQGAWEFDEEWAWEHEQAGRTLDDISAEQSLRELGNVFYDGPISPEMLWYTPAKDARVQDLDWNAEPDLASELPPDQWPRRGQDRGPALP